MTAFELDEYALLPASGVAESMHAAGIDATCPGAAPPSAADTWPAPACELDLRGLPAPEPMLRALAAVDALAPGAVLVLRTPMLPVPLLHALAERRLQAWTHVLADGSARVEIVGAGVDATHGRGGDGKTRA
ncbi:uncharacterized protein (DUF2249 family) [Lysobacter niabensis]|uniref:Uncharacterized protein (DUF2249 family) n=1 Tax=Agrilutibacter niabensis TaxID=380628 RepID=A0ABU1VNG4_9GAMM|nr:DUF2249 domain-containing protein [Lysobacter niabensis]MDR7099029.1 uncharacterized protein (DUF2249 family) [Lysobacter niabensis]